MPNGFALEQVKQYLPHREPLLLVDTVAAWAEDASIETRRTYQQGEMVFQGHFPDFPILPGMLSIEALAQSAGLLVNLSRQTKGDETRFLFMGVEQAKFRQPIHPEDTVEMHITQLQRRGDVYKFSGEAFKNGKLAVSATFSAKHVKL